MPDREEKWFRQVFLGRMEITSWKGLLALLALGLILVMGLTLETLTKQSGSLLLYYVVMVPVGLLTITFAWWLSGKIER